MFMGIIFWASLAAIDHSKIAEMKNKTKNNKSSQH